MLINKLDLFLVRLPLTTPVIVNDRPIEFCETVFSRLEGEGAVGWGEVAPGNQPRLTAEWAKGSFQFAKEVLGPTFISQSAYTDAKAIETAFNEFRGNRHAKALFDLAWWDLNAKLNEEPLWKTLGGSKHPIEVGLTFDRIEDPEPFYKEMARVLADNFRRVTLKFRPGWDLQIVSAARAELPPRVKLQIDVEGVLDLELHSEMFYRLEDFFLTLIEQPLAPDDAVVHAMLRETIKTPICLDESLESPLQANIAADLQAAQYFCMKPDRLGGHGSAKEVLEIAQANSIGCYGGSELQSPLGYRHLLALASLDNFVLPCDGFRFDELFTELPVPVITPTIHEEELPAEPDSGEPGEKVQYQAIDLWDEPGIGVEPDREIFDKYIIDTVSFERT